MQFTREFVDHWYSDFVDRDPDWNVLEEDLDPVDKDYTRETPATFHPTPLDVVYETCWWEGRTMCLNFSRGLDTITIYMEGFGLNARNHPLMPQVGPEDLEACIRKDYARGAIEELHAIRVCSEFIHNLDFSRTGMVFVRWDPSASRWRHTTRKAPVFQMFSSVKCPFHIIDEHEIRLTRTHGTNMCGYDEGIWRGVPVDVLRPRNHVYHWKFRLDIINVLHLHQHGLDYCYNYLAAIRRENKLIGVLCEARLGRVVRSHDYNKVCKAIRDIELAGLIHMEVNEQQIAMTHDGQVRFLLPNRMLHREMTKYTEREWQQLSQRRHDEALSIMFERLKRHERRGKGGWGFLSRYQQQQSFIVPRDSSPSLSLLTWDRWPSDYLNGEDILTTLMDEMRVGNRQGKIKKRRLVQRGSEYSSNTAHVDIDPMPTRASSHYALIRSGMRGRRGAGALISDTPNQPLVSTSSSTPSSLSDILAVAGYSPSPSSQSSRSGSSSWSLVERASSEARSLKSEGSEGSSWARISSVSASSPVSPKSDAWEEVGTYSASPASASHICTSANTQSSNFSFLEGLIDEDRSEELARLATLRARSSPHQPISFNLGSSRFVEVESDAE